MARRATVVNPRRRRRGTRGFKRLRRKVYVRNPRNILGAVKGAVQPGAGGFAGGFLAGIIDTKLLPKKRLLQGVAKLGASVLGAFVLRKKGRAADGFVGGMMGSIGYGVALKVGGGLIANTKGEAIAGLADMAAEDPELEGLLAESEDIADLVTASELADGEVEIADADDEDIADLVVAE